MIHTLRVIFGDTDQMGVVYYANYLRFFESARADYFRSLGRSYRDLEAAQVAMPVVEAHVNYLRPARYEDVLEIRVEITELKAASLRFGYEVNRHDPGGATCLATGHTRHAIVDAQTFRPKPLQAEWRALLRQASPDAS